VETLSRITGLLQAASSTLRRMSTRASGFNAPRHPNLPDLRRQVMLSAGPAPISSGLAPTRRSLRLALLALISLTS
jgi:hypothetical protein